MRRTAVLSMLLCLPGFQLALAQSLSVAYLEGQAQLRIGSSWTELATGSAVPLTSSVRLPTGGLVQIKGGGIELTLSRPGIYVVRDIVAARRAVSNPGIDAVVAGSLRHLVSGPTERQSTAMGGRAENESKSDDETWAETSSEVFLAAGKEYIKAGKYDKAMEQIREALEGATDQEAPKIHYYLAYAASLNGDVREAGRQIADLQPTTSDAWAEDFIILKAKLLEDTSAYAEAVALLTHEGNVLSQDAQRAPLYYFLLGLGCRGAGEKESAKRAFSEVVAISAESDLGRAATKLLRSQ